MRIFENVSSEMTQMLIFENVQCHQKTRKGERYEENL